MLVEGHYNGILQVDRNYIAIKKNLTNIDEAIERFRDEVYRTRMVEETYDYVLSQHTYVHRVERLLRIVTSTAPAEGSTRRAHSASVSEGT
jgi:spore maturation protein CgeB